jgi:hypothetical protein
MKRASMPRLILEIAVLRLTDARPFRDIDALIGKIERMESARTAAETNPPDVLPESAAANDRPGTGKPREEDEPVSATSQGAAAPAAPGNMTAHADKLWEAVKSEIVAAKPHFLHYLENCRMELLSPARMRLAFDPITLNLVSREESLKFIEETVRKVYNNDMTLELADMEHAVSSPREALSEKPAAAKKMPPPVDSRGKYQSNSQIVQDALDIFGGTVVR